MNQAHAVRIQFSLIPKCLNDLTVSIDDQQIIDCKARVDPDGSSFLKCGLYRDAGDNGSIKPTDRIWLSAMSCGTIAMIATARIDNSFFI